MLQQQTKMKTSSWCQPTGIDYLNYHYFRDYVQKLLTFATCLYVHSLAYQPGKIAFSEKRTSKGLNHLNETYLPGALIFSERKHLQKFYECISDFLKNIFST